jgi:hypothetical protein
MTYEPNDPRNFYEKFPEELMPPLNAGGAAIPVPEFGPLLGVVTPPSASPAPPKPTSVREIFDGKKADMDARLEALNNLQNSEVKWPKKKSARINPDAIPVLATAVALVALLMITSFSVSFSGIYAVAAWTGLPVFLQWLPAIFIDAAILAYTISLVVFKARGESTWRTFAGLTAFASVSVIANIAHTLAFWNGSLADFRAWVGVLITASAPIAVLLASEEITRLAFEKSESE